MMTASSVRRHGDITRPPPLEPYSRLARQRPLPGPIYNLTSTRPPQSHRRPQRPCSPARIAP